MREHMGLYRGKQNHGRWVEGYLYEHEPPLQCVVPEGYVPEKSDWYIVKTAFADWNMPRQVEFFKVDPETVGECTGLRDKNGKLIFEGDILRLYEKETEHEADGYCVIHFGRFKDTDALSDFDHLGWHITVTTIPNEATTVFALEEQGLAFEIIGNIHDNPELLKGGEGE